MGLIKFFESILSGKKKKKIDLVSRDGISASVPKEDVEDYRQKGFTLYQRNLKKEPKEK